MVAAATAGFYITMLVLLRVAGRRTLAQMSAFDVVITIALGSLLASTARGPASDFMRGLIALGVLLVLQLAIGVLRRRWDWFRRLSDFSPLEIGRDGRLELPTGVLGVQVTEGEVRSMLRQDGVFRVEDAALIVLEPNGRISVLHRGQTERDTG